MSPVRIETRSVDDQRIKHTYIKEAQKSFPVSPSDAVLILGISRTTLFRYDGPDVGRKPWSRRPDELEERVYDDNALLRIAAVTRKSAIRPYKKTELTELVSGDTTAVLDVPFKRAMEVFVNRATSKREPSNPQE